MKTTLIFLSLFNLNAFGAMLFIHPDILAAFTAQHKEDHESRKDESASAESSAISNQDTIPQLVQMPSAEVLKSRLRKTNMLVGEKTSLIEKLAGTCVAPLVAALHINLAMNEYVDYIESQKSVPQQRRKQYVAQARAKTPSVFAAVFEDNPECLAELKKKGISDALPQEKVQS